MISWLGLIDKLKGRIMPNKKDNLGDRMKRYEALTTSTLLMENLPVYARIDGNDSK